MVDDNKIISEENHGDYYNEFLDQSFEEQESKDTIKTENK